jgi:flagellar basal body-associated protein FliL
MAEVEKFETPAPVAPAEGGKKRKLMGPVLVLLVLVGEGLGVFVATKMIYRTEPVQAAPPTAEETRLESLQQEVEVALPEVRAFNKREGRIYICNLEVVLRVRADKVEEIQKMLEARKSTISDRLNTVIRSADVKTLNEPGLETLRRQFRFELDSLLGDDQLILELLIPKFFQSPANL